MVSSSSSIRYRKLKEDLDVQQHMRFYDRFHNELKNVIELDPHQDNGEPNGKRYNPITKKVEDCYYPDAIVELDSVVNPSTEHMESFRTIKKLKHFHTIPPDERRTLINEMARSVVRQLKQHAETESEEQSTTTE